MTPLNIKILIAIDIEDEMLKTAAARTGASNNIVSFDPISKRRAR